MRYCLSCGVRLFQVKPRETWHVQVRGDIDLSCMLIEELTPNTVVLRAQADVATSAESTAVRYALTDVRFVERVP